MMMSGMPGAMMLVLGILALVKYLCGSSSA